jgi:F0F1-type ATP synthase assembly protein I
LREDTKKFLKELFQGSYRASSIGLVLVLSILIGFGIGYWLSIVFDSKIFIIIGMIVGIIAGFREVYRMGKKYK